MNFSTARHARRSVAAKKDATDTTGIVDSLAGEALEGSGFENETPEADFEFDWTQAQQSQGGTQ